MVNWLNKLMRGVRCVFNITDANIKNVLGHLLKTFINIRFVFAQS